MSVSYIFEKKEIAYFLGKCFSEVKLPQSYIDDPDLGDTSLIEASLIKKGYMSCSGKAVSTEATIAFLIEQICSSSEYSDSTDKKVRIYFCSKVIILLSEDRLSTTKCSITPIQDEMGLAEILNERQIILNKIRSFGSHDKKEVEQ